MTRAELGTEWTTCAACGKLAWVYSLVKAPRTTTYRGKPIAAGDPIHRAHETLWNDHAREQLARFQASRRKT